MAVLYFINVFYQRKFSSIFFLSLAFGLVLAAKISGPQIIFVLFLALLLGKGFNPKQTWDFLKQNWVKIAAGLVVMFLIGGFWYVKSNLILNGYIHMARNIFSFKILSIVLLLIFSVIGLRKVFKKYRRIFIISILVIAVLGSWALLTHIDLVKTLLLGYKSPTPLLRSPAFYSDYPLLKTLNSPFLKNLLVFPFRIKDIGYYTSYTPDFLEKSGFGVQFFAFGLIAYIAAMILCMAKKKYRNGMVGYILIFSTTLLLSYFSYYFTPANYRLFMFFPVFAMILWAFVLTKIDLPAYYLKIIDVLILVMILFNAGVCLFEGNMYKNSWKTLFTISNPRDRTSSKYSFFFKGEDWKFIDRYIHAREPIGYTGHIDSWVFPYFDNQLKRKIHYLPSLPGFRLVPTTLKTARLEFNPTLVNSLKQRSIHFIHINPQGYRLRKGKISISIDDRRVINVAKNLYYFKW